MPTISCSVCGKRPRGRLASIYWACYTGDGSREAWKQRYDKEHYEEACAGWMDAARAAWNADGAAQCILCDKADSTELIETYATTFIPGNEVERFTIRACLEHQPAVATQTRLGGITLEDRSLAVTGGARTTGW